MQDPEQTPKSKRWIIMIGVVIAAFILYYIASYAVGINSTDNEERRDPPPSSSMSQTNEATQSKAVKPSGNSIIDTNLLTAPVPQDATVAQEEISKLQDQQAQLAERKTSLQEQLNDSDKLIELKEKYLADLQAEADKAAV
ncbi:MAG: hypothetical protein EOP04_15725 [Proteobacteria bacterium]|nr:MAG: hypothetical protein EOP04_15725 [Pseudomonadota bacterium]